MGSPTSTPLSSKILLDLLNKNTPSLEQQELIILENFLGKNWHNLSFIDRYKNCNIYNDKYNDNLEKFSNMLLNNLPILKVEAERITIPFIVQIAWLKQSYNYYQPTEINSPNLVKYDLITDESGEAVISYQEFFPALKSMESSRLENNSISSLNQILSNVPMFLTKQETMSKNYAVLNISLDKLTAVKDGNGLRGMVHGYNSEEHFGILENVRIFEPDQLQNIINSGLLVNFASTLLAQKHLADINKKLEELTAIANEIKEFQNNERQSKIYAAFESAYAHCKQLHQGNIIPIYAIGELQNHLTELQAIRLHLQDDLRKKLKLIESIKFDSLFNRNNSKDLSQITEEYISWKNLYAQYKLCCDTIIAIYSLLTHFEDPKNDMERFNSIRVEKLKQEIISFIEPHTSRFSKHIDLISKNSKSITNFDTTDQANSAFFKSRLDELQNIQRQFSITEAVPDKKIQIKVLVEDGKIVEANLLN